MMYLESPNKVSIKINGSTLHKSNKKSLKAILIKAKVKHIFSMILEKLIKELKMLKYSFGTKQKDKSSKYKLRINSFLHAQYSPMNKGVK